MHQFKLMLGWLSLNLTEGSVSLRSVKLLVGI